MNAATSLQRRTFDRMALAIPLRLVRGTRTTSVLTGNVSAGGLFLYTRRPPPIRELVRLCVEPPYQGMQRPLVMHAVATHVVEPDDPHGRPAGAGLMLYGVSTADRTTWNGLIRSEARAQLATADDEPYADYALVADPTSPSDLFHGR